MEESERTARVLLQYGFLKEFEEVKEEMYNYQRGSYGPNHPGYSNNHHRLYNNDRWDPRYQNNDWPPPRHNKPLYCDYCDSMFAHQDDLEVHIQYYHDTRQHNYFHGNKRPVPPLMPGRQHQRPKNNQNGSWKRMKSEVPPQWKGREDRGSNHQQGQKRKVSQSESAHVFEKKKSKDEVTSSHVSEMKIKEKRVEESNNEIRTNHQSEGSKSQVVVENSSDFIVNNASSFVDSSIVKEVVSIISSSGSGTVNLSEVSDPVSTNNVEDNKVNNESSVVDSNIKEVVSSISSSESGTVNLSEVSDPVSTNNVEDNKVRVCNNNEIIEDEITSKVEDKTAVEDTQESSTQISLKQPERTEPVTPPISSSAKSSSLSEENVTTTTSNNTDILDEQCDVSKNRNDIFDSKMVVESNNSSHSDICNKDNVVANEDKLTSVASEDKLTSVGSEGKLASVLNDESTKTKSDTLTVEIVPEVPNVINSAEMESKVQVSNNSSNEPITHNNTDEISASEVPDHHTMPKYTRKLGIPIVTPKTNCTLRSAESTQNVPINQEFQSAVSREFIKDIKNKINRNMVQKQRNTKPIGKSKTVILKRTAAGNVYEFPKDIKLKWCPSCNLEITDYGLTGSYVVVNVVTKDITVTCKNCNAKILKKSAYKM